MRTVLAAFAIATVVALPAQAQMPRDRNSPIFPKSLMEDRQPAYDFTQIRATDRENRPLLIQVSAARPGNRLPYRAIVAWSGAPDHYWSLAFAFDCKSRSLSRVDSAKRTFSRRYMADGSFPVAENYRGDFGALVAPVICDGQTGTVNRDFNKAFKLARDFIRPEKR